VFNVKAGSECAALVANPPSLMVSVFQPNAGLVQVPSELPDVINGEWSDTFSISITRPPFRTQLIIKPQTIEFETDPRQIEFGATSLVSL
jgi:hypothetical protein